MNVLTPPAEGDRDVVERELKRQADKDGKTKRAKQTIATPADISRLLGETDADTAAAITALRPNLDELEEAAVWVRGDGDILAKEGKSLAGKAAEIYDLARGQARST